MIKVRDPHSGAILIKKSPADRKIEALEKENQEMKNQISRILRLLEEK